MNTIEKSPFYLKFGITLIGLAVLVLALHFGKDILLPFFFSILLATLLLPITKKLQHWRLGKVLSIALPVIAALILIGLVLYFLFSQIGNFMEDIPIIQRKSKEVLWTAQKWVFENLNIGYKTQKEYLQESTETPGIVNTTVITVTGAITYLVLLPVYTSLILYHKDMIKKFIIEVFKDGDRENVKELLHQSQKTSQQYITGLSIEFSIVFTMNTLGFLWIDIKYPVFLGFMSALLNVVPYIGMLIANILCAAITLTSSPDPANVIWAAAVLMGVQLIDNNILMPLIVGNKVKLNALAIILGVLSAGLIAGIPAMFLAIPALSVLKLIFERVPDLKPWAMLLGDETTIEQEKINPVKNAFHKVRSKVKSRKNN